MTLQEILLLAEIACHLGRALTGNLDPGDGKEGARGEHESDVEKGMEGVCGGFGQGVRWGDIVDEATDWDELFGVVVIGLPSSQDLYEGIGTVTLEKYLGDKVKVRDESRLENDGHVGGVEELDGVVHDSTAGSLRLERELNLEALEVNHHAENCNGGKELDHVGHTLAVESFLQGLGLIRACEQELEHVDQSAFKLGTGALVEGVGRERFPHDAFADVGGDEETDC